MHQKGFVTLYSVIILGSMGLALVAVLMAHSIWSVRSSSDSLQSNQAKAIVNACSELALETIRENNSFTGSNNTSLGSGTCGYTVSNTGGTSRVILASSTVSSIIRKITISVDAVAPVHVSSWQEVP